MHGRGRSGHVMRGMSELNSAEERLGGIQRKSWCLAIRRATKL